MQLSTKGLLCLALAGLGSVASAVPARIGGNFEAESGGPDAAMGWGSRFPLTGKANVPPLIDPESGFIYVLREAPPNAAAIDVMRRIPGGFEVLESAPVDEFQTDVDPFRSLNFATVPTSTTPTPTPSPTPLSTATIVTSIDSGDPCTGPTVTFNVGLAGNSAILGAFDFNITYDNTRLANPAFSAPEGTFGVLPTFGAPSMNGTITIIQANGFDGSNTTFSNGTIYKVTFNVIGSSQADYSFGVQQGDNDSLVENVTFAPITASFRDTATNPVDCTTKVPAGKDAWLLNYNGTWTYLRNLTLRSDVAGDPTVVSPEVHFSLGGIRGLQWEKAGNNYIVASYLDGVQTVTKLKARTGGSTPSAGLQLPDVAPATNIAMAIDEQSHVLYAMPFGGFSIYKIALGGPNDNPSLLETVSLIDHGFANGGYSILFNGSTGKLLANVGSAGLARFSVGPGSTPTVLDWSFQMNVPGSAVIPYFLDETSSLLYTFTTNAERLQTYQVGGATAPILPSGTLPFPFVTNGSQNYVASYANSAESFTDPAKDPNGSFLFLTTRGDVDPGLLDLKLEPSANILRGTTFRYPALPEQYDTIRPVSFDLFTNNAGISLQAAIYQYDIQTGIALKKWVSAPVTSVQGWTEIPISSGTPANISWPTSQFGFDGDSLVMTWTATGDAGVGYRNAFPNEPLSGFIYPQLPGTAAAGIPTSIPSDAMNAGLCVDGGYSVRLTLDADIVTPTPTPTPTQTLTPTPTPRPHTVLPVIESASILKSPDDLVPAPFDGTNYYPDANTNFIAAEVNDQESDVMKFAVDSQNFNISFALEETHYNVYNVIVAPQPPMAEGSHTVFAKAGNNLGDSDVVTLPFIADRTAPQSIQNGLVGTYNASTDKMDLTWNTAVDPGPAPMNGGQVFLYYRDIKEVVSIIEFYDTDTTSGTSVAVPDGLDVNEPYLLGARLRDFSGNYSDTAYGSQFLINGRPQGTISIDPTAPFTNDDIVATSDFTDPDGDSIVSISYKFTRPGRIVDGPVLDAEETTKGQEWVAEALATDSRGGMGYASLRFVIANSPPTFPIVQILPRTPNPDQDLAVDVVEYSTDADGDEVGYDFRWYKSVDSGETFVLKAELNGSSQVSEVYIEPEDVWQVSYVPYEIGSGRARVEGQAGNDQVFIGQNNVPAIDPLSAIARGPAPGGGTSFVTSWSFADADNDPCVVDLFWTNADRAQLTPIASGLPATTLLYEGTIPNPEDESASIYYRIRDPKGSVSVLKSLPLSTTAIQAGWMLR